MMAVVALLVILSFGVSQAGTIAGHRAKRADDPEPLEFVVMQLSAELDQLKAQVTADKTQLSSKISDVSSKVEGLQNKVDSLHRHVAFLVRMGHSGSPAIPGNAPYKFDQIILNDGNSYDATIGVFTAPYTGVYVLSLQVFTYAGENPLVDIRVNNNPVTRVSVDTRNMADVAESTSSAVVTRLQRGDRAWVQASGDYTYYGVYHTFFTGALLYTIQ